MILAETHFPYILYSPTWVDQHLPKQATLSDSLSQQSADIVAHIYQKYGFLN